MDRYISRDENKREDITADIARGQARVTVLALSYMFDTPPGPLVHVDR